jgi:hypothetical protein
MRIPDQHELDTLPHVILTADIPFKYDSLDCILSDKADWYANTPDFEDG